MKKPIINYPQMLIREHRKAFYKHLTSLPISLADRIYCKDVYADIINIHNIQAFYAHTIQDFWRHFIAGTIQDLLKYSSSNNTKILSHEQR
jgi:hypothetical protein